MTDEPSAKEFERTKLLECSQCGKPLWYLACGPTHAVRWSRVESALRLDPGAPARIYNYD